VARFNNTQRPDAVSGTSCNSGCPQPDLYPNAFTLIGFHLGSIGSAPRGACHGPHYVNGDIGVYKNWRFKEKYGVAFQLDFFNAFNHSNFDATYIQGTGGIMALARSTTAAACTAVLRRLLRSVKESDAYTQYEPCGTSNNVVSAYGNGLTTGGATPGSDPLSSPRQPRAAIWSEIHLLTNAASRRSSNSPAGPAVTGPAAFF